MKKRVLSLLLAVALCFSTQPMTASAQGTDPVTVQEVQSGEDTAEASTTDVTVAVQDVSGGDTTGADTDVAGTSDDDGSSVIGGAETIGTDVSGNIALLTAQVQTDKHKHPVCGATCTDGEEHENVTWMPISKLTNDMEAGNYYLTKDIILTSDDTKYGAWIPQNDINLCLNGHTLTIAENAMSVVYGDISLCNCSSETKTVSCNSAIGITGSREFKLYDNVQITSTNSNGVYINIGTFIMYGGEISGCNFTAVDLSGSSSIFEMKGGVIQNNSSSSSYYSGGVYVNNGGTFRVSGTAKVTGNTANGATSNVYLNDGAKMIIGDAGLKDGASIGITLRNNPAEGGAVTIATGNVTGSSKYFSADARDPYGVLEENGALVLKNGVPHIHPVCGATCTDGDHPDSVEWKPISSLDQITENGNYYLAKDIKLDTSWTLSDKEVNLCLNGHNITITKAWALYVEDSAVLSLCNPHDKTAVCNGVSVALSKRNGGTLNLYDGVKITRTDHSGVVVYETGTFTMNGGTVCDSLRGVSVNGTFTMNKGNISDNTGGTGYGGGVYVDYNGNFTMTGGKISGNNSNLYGGGVFVYSSGGFDYPGRFTMTGGEISDNTATDHGGGVFIWYNTSKKKTDMFVVSGNVNITNNTVNGASNNVYLAKNDNTKITIGEGGLGSEARIGVTVEELLEEVDYTVIVNGLDHGYTDKTITSDNGNYKIQQMGDELILYYYRTNLHTHPICGRKCTHTGEDAHSTLVWKGISSLSEITKDGNYYLKKDISLNEVWEVPYDINLCLNGHDIKNAVSSNKYFGWLIRAENKTLSLCNADYGTATSVINGGVRIVDSASQLNLYSKVMISNPINNSVANDRRVVWVYDGTFNMYGGTICGGNQDGGVYVSDGTFVMKDGTITDNGNRGTNYPYGGAGVMVCGISSTFTMDGGTIKGNVSQGSGGGVYIYGGTFVMNGGTISDNTSKGSGSGVYVAGTFTMNGGTISGNNSSANYGDTRNNDNGGGVYVNSGTFTMENGTIKNNKAGSNGGGVAVAGNGKFVMSDGNITGNTSENRGNGVHLASGGTFTMKGGSITGNECESGSLYAYSGAVYASAGSNFTVSGTVNITGNEGTHGAENVYLEEAKNADAPATITIGEGLKEASNIGISKDSSTITGGNRAKIATGAEDGVDYSKIFNADATNAEYLVTKDDEGNVYLGTHKHNWVYTPNGATITLECSDCKESGGSVTVNAPKDSVYNGGEHKATVTASTDWKGTAVDEITVSYESGENGEFTPCNPPRNSGTYRAKITVGDATAMVIYEVKKADLGVKDFTFGSPDFPMYGWGINGYHEARISCHRAYIDDFTVKYYDENGKQVDIVRDAGIYTVKIDVAESKNFNAVEDLTWEGYWMFEIYPATLTVTPTAGQSKTYGNLDPEAFAYEVSGAKFDDEPVFTGTLGRAEGNAAGEYAITLGTLKLTDGANFQAKNYTLELAKTTVNFTINPKTLHSSDLEPLGSSVTKVYDGTTKVNKLDVVVDSNALVAGDPEIKVSGTAVYNSANVTEADSVIFTPDPITTGNYRLVATERLEVSGMLVVRITPATITVTPETGKTKTYGAKDPELDYTWSGEISGEHPLFTGALGREIGEDVGSYVINKGTLALMDNSDGNFRAGNYTLKVSDTPVDFVITKATPVITVGTKQLVKNGIAVDISNWVDDFNNTDADAKLIYTLVGTPAGITLDGNMLMAANAETTVNSFEITVTAEETTNFTAPEPKTFTVEVVEKADAGVKIDAPTSKTYGDENFTLKATTTATDNGTWSWTSSKPAVLEIVDGADTAEPTIRVRKADADGATLTATYTSNAYYGTASVTIAVAPKTITPDMVSEIPAKEYNGGKIQPIPELTDDEIALEPKTDFTFSYTDNTNAGTATITISGKGNYTGTLEKKFTIEPKSINGAIIVLGGKSRPYNGEEQTVEIVSVTVMLADGGSVTLEKNVDYAVKDNSDTATNAAKEIVLTIEGKGNYTGTATAIWAITKIAPTLVDFVVAPDLGEALTYNGESRSVAVTTAAEGMGEITVRYNGSTEKPVNAGSYAITIDVAEGSNYKAITGIEAGTLTIRKAAALTLADVKAEHAYATTGAQTVSLADLVAGATGYTLDEIAENETITEVTVSENGVLQYNLTGNGTAGSTVKVPVTIASTNYENTTVNVVITITQATPTGEPGYDIIHDGSKTLKDAGLDLINSTLNPKEGTLEWIDDKGNVLPDDTKMEEGRKYIWRFTPADPNYAPITGEVELYAPYRILEGADSTWTQNTDGTIVIRGDGEFAKFQSVKVDGTVIDAANYTAVAGSTIITLKADYLKTLSTGSHTFELVWTDGAANTKFTVAAKPDNGNNNNTDSNNSNDNDSNDDSNDTGAGNNVSSGNNTVPAAIGAPKTGDASGIWMTLFAVSLAGLAAMLMRKKSSRE